MWSHLKSQVRSIKIRKSSRVRIRTFMEQHQNYEKEII